MKKLDSAPVQVSTNSHESLSLTTGERDSLISHLVAHFVATGGAVAFLNPVTKQAIIKTLRSIAADEINAKYAEFAGFLGHMTGEIVRVSEEIYYLLCEHGIVIWKSGIGAHAVHGEIYQKYVSLGRENGLLGYPLSDETGTPDGIGRFNQFERGMIYWTPNTGAHEIHGAILTAWASMGWETSFLGYPLTDETHAKDGRGRYNDFQGGFIYWSPETGIGIYGYSRTWDSPYLGFGDGTALGGTAKVTMNNNGDWTFSGHMHDSGFDTYDFAVAAAIATPSGIAYTLSYRGRAEGTSAGFIFSKPRRDDNWTLSGNNPSIRDNWHEVARAVAAWHINSQDKLAAGISDAVQDALKELLKEGIKEGIKAVITLL